MKELGLQKLRVLDIDFGDRLRQVDPAHADLLAQNMREVGRLRQPIEVRTRKGKAKGVKPYLLIAGGHRLRAADMLAWEEIDAFVFEMTDDEARLAEIDENLVRHELNPLDRAVFLAERKALYERLHPEAKAGGDRRSSEFQSDTVSVWSFAKDTAEKCGLTDRTIQRAVAIANGINPAIRQRIAGTWLAHKQSELLALIKLSPSEQMAALDLLLCEPPQCRSVASAEAFLKGVRATEVSGTEKSFQKLLADWGRADRAARRQFLRHLQESGILAELLADEKEAA